MLKKIKSFFEKNLIVDTAISNTEHQLNLAAAALLVEMILQDDKVELEEVKIVKQSLVEQLGLSQEEAGEIYQLAEEERHSATDYHQFTQLIGQHYSQAQKIVLIESLWRVAYADKVLDKYEEHMVRRIADLIHVSHKDFLQAKLRVEKSV